jgi:hypothetical protein
MGACVMAEREWVGLGDGQEVTGHRQLLAEQRMEAAYAYAIKSATHLWFITLSHQATDQTLDVFDGQDGTPLLDADTLLMRPAVGCYVCEQPYEPRLRRRRCPGEPRGGGR